MASSLRGCDWLFSAAGFIDDIEELSLPSRTDPSWLLEELKKFKEKNWDLSEVGSAARPPPRTRKCWQY